ncbi:MAG: ferritin-like domain-containing protein [Anaerolineae bacterium]|nr:ferritin-like domain-containing protein [Anaerolineae bacterium]
MPRRRLHTAYNVALNRWLVQRYAYVEERLFTICAGWIWTTPRREDKVEFGYTSYEDANHADALRKRTDELSPSVEEPIRTPDFSTLETFCNEVANAVTPVERFVGLFRVLKPCLLAAYRRHQAETDELLDGPTDATLRQIIAQEEQHIAWGESILREIVDDPEATQDASNWQTHLESIWAAIGGFHEIYPNVLSEYRNPQPPNFFPSSFPARDRYFTVVSVEDYTIPRLPADQNESIRQLLLANTHGEMEAEEMLSRVLAESPDLPWSMRLDLARQMWDEARHTQLAWQRMEELGGVPDPLPPVISSIVTLMEGITDPLERLIILQRAVEGRATDLLHARGHALTKDFGDMQTARMFEYLIADERSHIGNSRWLDRLVGDNPSHMARLQRVQAQGEQMYESIIRQARAARERVGMGGAR